MIVDLSHLLEEGMPIYPGTEPPDLQVTANYEADGFRESRINILTHVGTHLDCPAHIYPDGLSVSDMPINQFYGSGVVLDCSELDNQLIDEGFLNHFHKQTANKDFILFATAWDKKWGNPAYFESYPTFTEAAIRILARMPIKGIGIDTISIDPVGASNLKNHHLFLSEPKIIIENLHNLEQLINNEFNFVCFPLRLKAGDGSPIRAVAVLK